jgi:ABC-type iron transport system FetAB permease component
MTAVDALGADDLSIVAGLMTIVLVVVGGVLAMVVTSVAGRVTVLVMVVSLAVAAWLMRSHVRDQFSLCHEHPTFFGVHVDKPDNYLGMCGR